MSADSKKSLFRDAVQLWQAGDLAALERVIAPGYIGHVSSGDRDLQGLRQRIEGFHRLYTDVVFHIEDQIVDGDKVVTRLSAEVTRRDSRKRAKLIGINISRIAQGQIVEEWATWEPLATEPANSETR
jgi:predicted ester cyclase